MKYDVNHFINKFEAIPEEKWITGGLFDYPHTGNHCALGHLGLKSYPRRMEELSEEVQAFVKLTGAKINIVHKGFFVGIDWHSVYLVNDGGDASAKDNVLSFLYKLKARENATATIPTPEEAESEAVLAE